ncbi:MAG: RtcB family protein [Alphaproteobacteria bacterium]|nr:RtcB family protein [Alphaproteobacteria bacterium]
MSHRFSLSRFPASLPVSICFWWRGSARVVEEAPGAYKDVDQVISSAEHAGLARRVARLAPVICIKG